jgi:hypothetical protein
MGKPRPSDNGSARTIPDCSHLHFFMLFRERPDKHNFMPVMMADAGAAYLNGGLGRWESIFTAIAYTANRDFIPMVL